MKKLSLVRALVLVLTCGVLAACGDETETSSAADVQSSEVKTESSAAAESSETAAESSEAAAESSDAEESSQAPALEAGENVAAGKTYVTSELFRQDSSWQWDPESPIAYPDENGTSLTDGVVGAADSSYDNAVWAGFHTGGPDYLANGYDWVTVDLGASYDLVKFAASIGTSANLAGGPSTVEVYVSDDGETWSAVAAAMTATNPADSMCETVTAELSEAVSGQYVQFRFIGTGHWMHVAEVEAYAAAG